MADVKDFSFITKAKIVALATFCVLVGVLFVVEWKYFFSLSDISVFHSVETTHPFSVKRPYPFYVKSPYSFSVERTYPFFLAIQGSFRPFPNETILSSYKLSLASFLVTLFPKTFHCRPLDWDGLLRLPKTLVIQFALDKSSFYSANQYNELKFSLFHLAVSLRALNIRATFADHSLVKSFVSINTACQNSNWCKYVMVLENDWFFLPSVIPYQMEDLWKLMESYPGIGSVRFRKNTINHKGLTFQQRCPNHRDDLPDIGNSTEMAAEVWNGAVNRLHLDTPFSNNPRLVDSDNELQIYRYLNLEKLAMQPFEGVGTAGCHTLCKNIGLKILPTFGELWRKGEKDVKEPFEGKVWCGLHSIWGPEYSVYHMDGRTLEINDFVLKATDKDAITKEDYDPIHHASSYEIVRFMKTLPRELHLKMLEVKGLKATASEALEETPGLCQGYGGW